MVNTLIKSNYLLNDYVDECPKGILYTWCRLL